MNLWTDLPTALTVSLVEDWLKFNTLVPLDIACCSHASRSVLLACFQCATIGQEVDPSMGSDDAFCRWIISRKFRLESVTIDIGCVGEEEDGCKGEFFARCGQHIHSLSLSDRTGSGLRVARDAAKYCTNVTKLTLGSGVSDAVATLVLSCCAKLNVVKIIASNVTSYTLHGVGKFCSQLTQLIVMEVADATPSIGDAGLLSVAKGCPDLEFLAWLAGESISTAGLAVAIPHWPKLTFLNVSILDRRALRAVAASCPKLKSLKVLCCAKLKDPDLLLLLHSCQQLTQLVLENCPHFSCNALRTLANLDTLTLTGNKHIDYSTVETILVNCPAVEHLGLENCPRLDTHVITYVLDHGHHIESLILSNTLGRSDTVSPYKLHWVLSRVVHTAYPRIKVFCVDFE